MSIIEMVLRYRIDGVKVGYRLNWLTILSFHVSCTLEF